MSKASSPLEALPQELFFHVIAFVGPTRDLLSLTQASHQIHSWLELVGHSVAKTTIQARNFRKFLTTQEDPTVSPIESNLCLIVRHAKYVESVRGVMQTLHTLIAQESQDKAVVTEEETWETAEESGCGKRKLRSSLHEDQPPLKKNVPHIHRSIRAPLSYSEYRMGSVDIVLNLLSSCLGLSVPNFANLHDEPNIPAPNDLFITDSTMDQFLQLSCPRSIERLFLFLCGKLCAKVYKTVKARIALQRTQNVCIAHSSSQPWTLSCRDDHSIIGNLSLDEQRLVYFRRILHHVFVRVLDLSSVLEN